ncbi:MAG: Hsp70 family protein [Verrucomicrobia bacterium]|nr:Hsp70 family protein [Verrucomicrobiota bacterium]
MIAGIDLGTTNSLIGVMEAGFPVLLADAEGRRLTPSVVHYPAEAGAAPVVGAAAARVRLLQPARTVHSIKRFIGARGGETTTAEDAARMPYDVVAAPGAPVRVRLGEQLLSPEEISAQILAKLKADAERALGVSVDRAVITVPAYFNDAQRAATQRAGELAGFQVERILNEPTAAALTYGLQRLGERARVAVFDFGGGTFDLSILELREGLFQVLSTNGNTRLGGDDIDALVADELARRLQAALPAADPHAPLLRAALREAAEQAKIRLSDVLETPIEIPFAAGTESFACTFTRADLETLARPVVERTRRHCLRALEDAKCAASDLQAVVLVGGSTRMPLVRQFAGELFGREPDTTQHPDEAIALGAVIQAGILSGAVQNVTLLDVTPLSLGLETLGGLMNVLIPRNSTIPTKAGEMFTNAAAGQRAMRIHVLQGEREMARDNFSLGSFELEFESAPRGQARVGVQFSLDASGILTVLARDTKTGAERVVELRSAVDVSDQAVEQMLAGSLEHAFDDFHERRLTEARLKAEELLPAVRAALASAADLLPAAEQADITEKAAAVEAAIAGDSLPALQSAVRALDDATQALAAALVERAMEEAVLRKL